MKFRGLRSFHGGFVLLSLAHSPVNGRSDAPPSSYYDSRSQPNPDPQSAYWHPSEENKDVSTSRNLPPPPPPPQNPEYGQEQQYQYSQQTPPDDPSDNRNEYSSFQPRYQEESKYHDNNAQSSSPKSSSSVKVPKMPIHYDFPATASSNLDDNDDDADRENDDAPKFASARRDITTTYMSTKSGKLQVMASSAIIGGGSGFFLAKSVIPFGTPVLGTTGAVSFLIGTLFRTPFGELVRALGLSLILLFQRTSKLRKSYPTWRYVAAFFGISSRNLRPFPPAQNPWRYTPRRPDDVEFSMLYSIIAMSFVGSLCGGNMPFIPTWMGSLAGAGLFALGCTLSSARGDLYRTMGMRVVALLQELWDIQADLKIIPKAAVVTSQVLDKLLIFDRKHRVKDRFLDFVTKGYDQVVQMKEDSGAAKNDDRDRDRSGGRRGGRDERDNDRDMDRERQPSRRDRRDSYNGSPQERRDSGDRRDDDRSHDRFSGRNADTRRDDLDRGEEKPKRGGFWRK